jgi:hypothetical protein
METKLDEIETEGIKIGKKICNEVIGLVRAQQGCFLEEDPKE